MVNFSKSDLIEQAWELVKKHFWFLVGITVFLMFISAIPSFFGQENQSEPLVLGIAVLLWIVQIFLSIGITYITLKLGRGEEATWADLWAKKYLFWRYLGGSILMGLIVMVGFVLLILPGIWLSIRLQFFTYALVDKDVKILEALRMSWDMTEGNWWNLFAYNILLSLIVMLGFILLIVGIFVAIPVAWLGYALVYLKLTEQQTDTAHLESATQ